MRSVSGAFNRIILATFGLALVAAASWFVASGLGAGRYWPDADRYLAPAQDSFSSIVAPLTHSNWLIPICALLSLFAIVAGAFVLIKQIPRKAAASPLRITGSEGSLVASLAPDVLSQALSERAQEIPGVEQCSVWVPQEPVGSGRHHCLSRQCGRMGCVCAQESTQRGHRNVPRCCSSTDRRPDESQQSVTVEQQIRSRDRTTRPSHGREQP